MNDNKYQTQRKEKHNSDFIIKDRNIPRIKSKNVVMME